LLNNKKEKKRDREESNLPTISKNRHKRRMIRLNQISLMSNILLSGTKLFKTNKRRVSIPMPNNASQNGRVKAKMSNLSSWSLKITKKGLYEKYNDSYIKKSIQFIIVLNYKYVII